jgi:hypothetical protein
MGERKMSEFLAPDDAVTKAVNASNTFQDLRESMLQALEKAGTIVRPKGEGEFAVRVNPNTQPIPEHDTSVPASGWKFEKEIRFAESTGRRTLLIHAQTPEDLAALERQILGY